MKPREKVKTGEFAAGNRTGHPTQKKEGQLIVEKKGTRT